MILYCIYLLSDNSLAHIVWNFLLLYYVAGYTILTFILKTSIYRFMALYKYFIIVIIITAWSDDFDIVVKYGCADAVMAD